jgi:hypothetical protein
VDQPLFFELVEGVAVEVSSVQLEVGAFGDEGPLLQLLIDPVSYGGVFEPLEGGDLFSVSCAYILQSFEGVHPLFFLLRMTFHLIFLHQKTTTSAGPGAPMPTAVQPRPSRSTVPPFVNNETGL